MTVKELIDTLDESYRCCMWRILVDGFPLDEVSDNPPELSKEVGKWYVDNSLEGRFFVQVLRIYTAECLENSRAFNETMVSALTETVKMHEIARKKKGEQIMREL